MITCPECGATEIPDSMKICPACGRKLKTGTKIPKTKPPGFKEHKISPIGITLAVMMGLLSGLMIYFFAFFIFSPESETGAATFAAVFVLGGWILSTHILLKNAKSTAHVLSRGFLLGAGEWFAMILAFVIMGGRIASQTIAEHGGSGAAVVGVTIGGGIAGAVSIGLCISMVVVCLIGYAITYFIRKEF